MSTYMLGRKDRSYNPRIPHMSALLAGRTRSTPPAAFDWSTKMPNDLGMMLNDRLGDCTKAGWYHAQQVWTFNTTGVMQTASDATVLKSYEIIDHYNPKDPSTDQGGNEQVDLTYAVKHGMPEDDGSVNKLAAFVEIDPRNTMDVKRAIVSSGLVYIGFKVPAFLVPQGAPPPKVWTVDHSANNTIVGGHAVIQPGYDAVGLTTVSWGSKGYKMTWAFFERFVEEVYALVDADWVNSKGTTPAGLTLAEWEAQVEALKAA